MAMFLAPLLMVFTSFNLIALLGCLVIWQISMLVIKFQGIGVKVPITSSVYGYTKFLAHNLNSKKTSGAAIG